MRRIRYQKVSDDAGEEVPAEHIVKGFEVSRGRFVMVDPDELEQFIPAVTKTIDLEEFVDIDQIDPVSPSVSSSPRRSSLPRAGPARCAAFSSGLRALCHRICGRPRMR